MSGAVPLVAAMMGPCAAGTAYIPGLADFVPMVVGQGAMALAGPHLVKAVTGEDISMEDLGGAKVHCRKSGVGDLEVKDDRECIEVVKRYLSYFPANCEEQPPVRPTDDPEDRMSERLLDIVPESSRQPYDMYEVIREIVDDGEILDIKPKWARSIITCLARFGGQPVGVVANQPKHLGGILENDSADKAARFINLCDAFNIPLVFLQDVPGFMVGSQVEHAGIIRHGAKMLYAVSRATVPKVTVVIRKAYGAGYYVMNGAAYEPDQIYAWPSAEISVMGPEGAVNIIGRSAIEASDDPEATRQAMLDEVRKVIDPYIAAGERDDRRHHRPPRDPPAHHRRPAHGEGQAGRAAVEEAWGDAGMSYQLPAASSQSAAANGELGGTECLEKAVQHSADLFDFCIEGRVAEASRDGALEPMLGFVEGAPGHDQKAGSVGVAFSSVSLGYVRADRVNRAHQLDSERPAFEALHARRYRVSCVREGYVAPADVQIAEVAHTGRRRGALEFSPCLRAKWSGSWELAAGSLNR